MTNTVERTPWRETMMTQIWDVAEFVRNTPGKAMDNPKDDASLGVWLIHAPWMAIAWHWHYVGLVHLRNIPGQSRPPRLAFPEATHELMAFAVDPSTPPDLSAAQWKPLEFLTPVSVVQQFVAQNDAEALKRVEHMLGEVALGRLSVEADSRNAWRELLLGRAPVSL